MKHAAYALGRLMRRHGVLVPLGFAAMLATLVVSLTFLAAPPPGDGAWEAQLRVAFLVATAFVAGGLGMTAHDARLALERITLGWMLPALRTKLRLATRLLSAAAATAFAGMGLWLLSHPEAVAAFALAFFAFNAAGALQDDGIPAALRRIGWLPLLLIVMSPLIPRDFLLVSVGAALTPTGLLVSAIALAAVGMVLERAQFSETAARRRLRLAPQDPSRRPPTLFGGSAAVDRAWTTPLAGGDARTWLRAAAFEQSQGARYWPLLLGQVAVVVIVPYMMRSPDMMVILVGMSSSSGSLLLGSSLRYPLSRRERAILTIAGSTVRIVTFFALLAGLLALLHLLSDVMPIIVDATSRSTWPMAAALAFALAPIAQWGEVDGRSITTRFRRAPLSPRDWVTPVVYMITALVLTALIVRGPLPNGGIEGLLVVAGIGAVVWAGYFVAVFWHFARRDLVT